MSGIVIPSALRAGDVLLEDADGGRYVPGPAMIEAIRAAKEGRPIPGAEHLNAEEIAVLNAMMKLAAVAPGNRAQRRADAARRRGRR